MKKLLITMGALAIFETQAGSFNLKERKCQAQAQMPDQGNREIWTAVCCDNFYITNIISDEPVSEFTFYVPNTFTPNNDGLNDTFKIYGSEISSLKLEIYTRQGEKIFESTNLSNCWDGNYKGYPCGMATYVYFWRYIQQLAL